MLEQVLEGTWEEIINHSDELSGKRVRVTVIEEPPVARPNVEMLEAIRKVAERNQGKPLTSGEDTLKMIREARSGRMFGYDPIE